MDFYFFSKLFWFFAAPSHFLVWLVVAGALLSGYRIGRVLLVLAAASFLLLMFVPVGDWALSRLEDEYPRPPWPAHVDGVLELGGGLNAEIFKNRALPGAPGEGRTVAAFEVARRYPNARIIFSGGGDPKLTPETVAARYVFDQMGVDPGRITYENRSRNTWENFTFSKKLANPKPGETWLLITSAFHMPRAMAIARQVGWPVTAWASDYITLHGFELYHEDLEPNLANLDLAAHEYLGILAYRLSGRAR